MLRAVRVATKQLAVVDHDAVHVAMIENRVAPILLHPVLLVLLPHIPDGAVGGLQLLQAVEYMHDLSRVDSDALWWLQRLATLRLRSRFTKWMECCSSWLLWSLGLCWWL